MFCERARAHDPDFDLGDGQAVAEICRRVDGLPLAIELAAARCGLLAPAEIVGRLVAALGTPGAGARDAPARQQTLGATIDWSHQLLSDAEQRCFARFAVFAGGATVEAGETITGGGLDTLDGLVAKSMLLRRRHAFAPTRLGMLETIRAYAGERFAAASDVEAVREAHYRYYLALAERHGADRALRGAGAREHLARLDAEIDNLHAALGWAIAQPGAEPALALTAALGCYWVMRNRYADAVDWVDRALSLDGAQVHPAHCVRALGTKATCLWQMGRGPEQPPVLAEAEAIARRLGDPVILSQALQRCVYHEMDAERLDAADARADEAMLWARAAGDDWEIAEASRAKAIAASKLIELRERVETAATLLTDVGNIHELAGLLTGAAYSGLCLGSDHDAMDFAARATSIARGLDSRYAQMISSGNVGLAALLSGATEARRMRSARSSGSAERSSSGPSRSRVFAAWPPSPRSTATTGARRRSWAPPTPTVTTWPRSGRGQARRGVLRTRPHAVRDRRMEHRRARRQCAQLRGRDRLRARRDGPAIALRDRASASGDRPCPQAGVRSVDAASCLDRARDRPPARRLRIARTRPGRRRRHRRRPSSGRSDAVTIDNFKFAPATLDVKSGGVVTVTNADSTAHTATADGGAFDTGDIDPGASKTITLGEAGRVTYHCQIHPFMKATIVVS